MMYGKALAALRSARLATYTHEALPLNSKNFWPDTLFARYLFLVSQSAACFNKSPALWKQI